MGWRKPKKLKEVLNLEPGDIIYIEEGEVQSKIELLNWHKVFQLDSDRVIFNFNDPNTDPTAS